MCCSSKWTQNIARAVEKLRAQKAEGWSRVYCERPLRRSGIVYNDMRADDAASEGKVDDGDATE